MEARADYNRVVSGRVEGMRSEDEIRQRIEQIEMTREFFVYQARTATPKPEIFVEAANVATKQIRELRWVLGETEVHSE